MASENRVREAVKAVAAEQKVNGFAHVHSGQPPLTKHIYTSYCAYIHVHRGLPRLKQYCLQLHTLWHHMFMYIVYCEREWIT